MAKREHNFNCYMESEGHPYPDDDIDKAVAWVVENYDRERLDAVARMVHRTVYFFKSKKKLQEHINAMKTWNGIYSFVFFWILGGGSGDTEDRLMNHFGLVPSSFPTIRASEWCDYAQQVLWGGRTGEFELPDK